MDKETVAPVVNDSAASERFADQFRSTVLALTKYAAAEDIELIPYQSESLELFRSLPLTHQEGIAASLSDYCDTMTTIRDQNEPLKFNLNAVWLQLRKRGLRCSNDLFELLEPRDIVEIYSLEGRQIFRSFHFFQYCSYDLETISCRTWFELYARDSAIDDMYQLLHTRFHAGDIKGTELLSIPQHDVKERYGKQFRTKIKPKLLSITFDRVGNPAGFVHAVDVKSNLFSN